jgi:hypothetical protein
MVVNLVSLATQALIWSLITLAIAITQLIGWSQYFLIYGNS